MQVGENQKALFRTQTIYMITFAADTSECEDLWDHSESDATDTNRSFKDDNTDGRDFDMDGLYDVEELFEDIEDYNPPDYASDDYWDDLF